MAYSDQTALPPTGTPHKNTYASPGGKTWSCQHSFIFTADQHDHTEMLHVSVRFCLQRCIAGTGVSGRVH